MEVLVAFFAIVILGMVMWAAISALIAFPVMWLINAVFTPYVLEAVFGGPISWLQAWGLLILCGILFKSTSSSSSKKD